MAKATQKPEAAAPAVAAAAETVAASPIAAGGETGAASDDPLPAHEGEQTIPAAPRTVRARVLAFCALGAPDDVIELDAAEAEKLGDVIDTHPAAVAYAESLKA